MGEARAGRVARNGSKVKSGSQSIGPLNRHSGDYSLASATVFVSSWCDYTRLSNSANIRLTFHFSLSPNSPHK